MPLDLSSKFQPTGDQPRAIKQLTGWISAGHPHATLLGVTGSGKTFTMASVIAATRKPTLVISPNKTLAAQLYSEFREFFPSAAVRYFVSYYDYYQPEAYIPQTDTYIGKEAMINEEIDRLRHATTEALCTRQDVIIVASVSCIYGLGSPEEYGAGRIVLRRDEKIKRAELLRRLIDLQFQRNDVDLGRGTFRVRGETVEIFPKASDKEWIRIELSDNGIAKITARDIGGAIRTLDEAVIFPATHYIAPTERMRRVIVDVRTELAQQLNELRAQNNLLEAQRLEQRVNYDLQMIEETDYVHGIENYSRYFDGRKPGEPPFTLIDFFNYSYSSIRHSEGATATEESHTNVGAGHGARSLADARDDTKSGWLCFIDESHITIPQIRGMHAGDRSRKATLVNFGFRLPSCLDNRPLTFNEFAARTPQTIYVSATPEAYEIQKSEVGSQERRGGVHPLPSPQTGFRSAERAGMKPAPTPPETRLVAEQLIRPTGLLDPEVEVRPTEGQIADLIKEIARRTSRKQRTLVTVLTKRMAEDLSEYLREQKINAYYIHADIETFERIEILDDLRRGKYDVIVGINLLREGLDLPEVSLVAVLDADQEGYLRSRTALVQTMGRAARHVDGRAILYADRMTESMRLAIAEVKRRRAAQERYNHEHGIVPQSIEKEIRGPIIASGKQASNNKQSRRKQHRPKSKRTIL
ncbi:MAG: excinuclease ABC subunit UvrB [Candidatus Uhrbacteria bacterium]